MRFSLRISVFLTAWLFSACGQNNKSAMYQDYQELHKHQGSANYEVVELFDKDFKFTVNLYDVVPDLHYDTADQHLIVYGNKENELERTIHRRLKMSVFGDIEAKGPIFYVLQDGTLWGSRKYCNWIIDGNKDRKKYIDPFSNKAIENIYEFTPKETDPQKWLKKFKECYYKADYMVVSPFVCICSFCNSKITYFHHILKNGNETKA